MPASATRAIVVTSSWGSWTARELWERGRKASEGGCKAVKELRRVGKLAKIGEGKGNRNAEVAKK